MKILPLFFLLLAVSLYAVGSFIFAEKLSHAGPRSSKRRRGVAGGQFWILPTNNETNSSDPTAPNIEYTTYPHPIYHNSSVRALVLKNPNNHWFVSCPGCQESPPVCTGEHRVVSEQATRNRCLYATNAAPFDMGSSSAKCSGNVVANGVVVKRAVAHSGDGCLGLYKLASSAHAGHWIIGLDGSDGVQRSLDANEFEQLVCGFGLLVVDGKAMHSGDPEIAPRTAWGIDAKGSLVSLVADGAEKVFTGLTLNQTAELLVGAGAVYAVNMDGGGSSTVFFDGKVRNCPSCVDTPSCCERSVETIQCIK